MDTPQIGQRVRFDTPHPSMNPYLRWLKGQVAEVVAIGQGAQSDKVLVDFGEAYSFEYRRWWIKVSRLSFSD